MFGIFGSPIRAHYLEETPPTLVCRVVRMLKMAIITLQLGQCGNQIGRQLFTKLHEDALGVCQGRKSTSDEAYRQVSLSRFFNESAGRRRGKSAPSSNSQHGDLKARAVLVDMESKAVNQTLTDAERSGHWSYDDSSVYTQKRGSGNNWASGYLSRAPAAAQSILDMVQSQVEKCDRLSGFLVLMSVAGGTGSGVGSYLTECLRDDYPCNTIFNTVVWPYASGEVIVQDYNALLTTKHLQDAADTILILQNDQLQKAASKLLLLKDISFSDLNQIISHSLAGFLQPAFDFSCLSSLGNRRADSFLYNQCLLGDIQSHLCPWSDFKMISVKSIPQIPECSQAYTCYFWPGLLKHLRQMLISDAPIEEGMDWTVGSSEYASTPFMTYEPREEGGREGGDGNARALRTQRGVNRSLANLFVLRGNELDEIDKSLIAGKSFYCRWTPPESSSKVWCSSQAFDRYEKSCTLLSNNQSCVLPLETTCRKAWLMYTSRAYTHQYIQNGLDEQDLLDCFAGVEKLIKSYATLS